MPAAVRSSPGPPPEAGTTRTRHGGSGRCRPSRGSITSGAPWRTSKGCTSARRPAATAAAARPAVAASRPAALATAAVPRRRSAGAVRTTVTPSSAAPPPGPWGTRAGPGPRCPSRAQARCTSSPLATGAAWTARSTPSRAVHPSSRTAVAGAPVPASSPGRAGTRCTTWSSARTASSSSASTPAASHPAPRAVATWPASTTGRSSWWRPPCGAAPPSRTRSIC
mmetsp:Transcript_61320/g.190533  ORF Transcript_61320/g.190533 Transcript_61320/m.190533 type:complete len:224 (+) Transcript_61320:414-1085(+)